MEICQVWYSDTSKFRHYSLFRRRKVEGRSARWSKRISTLLLLIKIVPLYSKIVEECLDVV